MTHSMYMMTPRDQISQLLSYFSGPNTSGAEKFEQMFKIMLLSTTPSSRLTDVVWRVARRLEGVAGVGLLGEAEVGQLQNAHAP